MMCYIIRVPTRWIITHKLEGVVKGKKSLGFFVILLWAAFFSATKHLSCQMADTAKRRFEIFFPASANTEPIAGRVFVMIFQNDER